MRVAVFFGVLAVAIAGLLLVKDRSATTLLRDELATYRLDDLVSFESLRVVDLDQIDVSGGRLTDPLTGRVVAQVGQITIDMAPSWIEGDTPTIRGIRGQGGRVLLDWEDGELLLARALDELIVRIIEALPAGPHGQLPPLTFDDLEVVAHGRGFALERFERVSVSIFAQDAGVETDIVTGDDAGRVRLSFDGDGLHRVEVDALRFRPVLAQFAGELEGFIGRTLGASGVLDLEVDLRQGSAGIQQGTLRHAYLDTTLVPFPLGPATIPFRYVGDEITIEEAVVGFEGGTVVVTAFGPPTDFTMTLDVERARFREEFLNLVPAYRELDFITCSDGGSYELHLTLPIVDGAIGEGVIGRGGFLVDTVLLQPPGLELEQVVGRFEIDDEMLTYPEVSARCAGGGLRANGEVDMAGGLFDLELVVEDVDIDRAHVAMCDSIHPTRAKPHSVAGWLQGELHCSGELGSLGRTAGYGQLSVRAGDLWDTPLIESLFMALPETSGPRGRHRLEVAFNLIGRQVFVDPVRIESDLFTLRGSGVVDMRGRLDLELVPIAVPLGWFGRIVEQIQQRFLVNLVVSGTIDEPQVTAMPMDVVTGPVRRAFSYLLGADDEGGDADVEDEP